MEASKVEDVENKKMRKVFASHVNKYGLNLEQ